MTGAAARLLAVAGATIAFFAVQSRAQISVLSPKSLAREFKETKGKIEGSTATFGAPFYGDKVLGRLVWGVSKKGQTFCTEDDYDIPPPATAERSGYSEIKLINIVMVRRGGCSFTTKVRVAYNKGAHAVVIVDKEDSKLTTKDLRRIIVADDGYGNNIHIPSILISKTDGAALINAAMQDNSPVIIELSWDVPTDHVVRMDLWMSSASRESQKFLRDFAPKRRALNEVVSFRPHYAVFGMPASDPAVYNGVCSDSTGEFCAEDPDGVGAITGKDVLEEDVRQLCIHEQTKVQRTTEQSMKAGIKVDYAEKYWRYVESLELECPLDGTTPSNTFGTVCSERLMHKVGLDVQAITTCVETTRTKKLTQERENPAWSPRALRINGWRYSGMFSADLVTRAICSAFIIQPPECESLLAPRDPFAKYTGAPVIEGVSVSTFVSVLAVASIIVIVAGLFYKRSLKQSVRTALREEVMLEVEAQMGEYRQLGRA